jgi:DNA replication protein DnaC
MTATINNTGGELASIDPDLDRLSRRLRLPYLRAAAPDVLATAKAQRWAPAETVRALLVEEERGRDHATTSIRRRKARLPTGKTFDVWDPTISSIAPATQSGLRTLEWIDRHENLVICGPSGTGKSMFLEALGHAAIDSNRTVAWFSVEQLGTLVRAHRVDDTINRAITPILRSDLIIVDDIGLLPLSVDAAEGLYRLIDAAYEKRAVAISSNLHPSGFEELMPRTIATALVDRLLHHAHVIVTSGDSVRLAQATTGKGVKPFD